MVVSDVKFSIFSDRSRSHAFIMSVTKLGDEVCVFGNKYTTFLTVDGARASLKRL